LSFPDRYFGDHPELNVDVKFGTLTDYFAAVRERTPNALPHRVDTASDAFATYHGDFFTYVPRGQVTYLILSHPLPT